MTSSSANALSSDSIGTACRTFLKRPDGAAPTFCDGDELVTNSGNLPQRVVFGVRNLRRVVLVVSPIVAFERERQPLMLDLGLRLGELCDVGGRFWFC
jgi:hypothetical protein